MIQQLSLDAWSSLPAAERAPSFFMKPAWTRALCSSDKKLTPSPLLVSTDRGRFLFPAVRSQARFGMRDVIAFPMGGYTAVLREDGEPADPLTSSHVLHAIGTWADRMRAVPYPLLPQPCLPEAASQELETAVVDCEHGFDAVLHGMRGVTRRMAGQAERRGVIVERVPQPLTEFETYYRILEEASVGWGLAQPPISRALLAAVLREGGDDAQLWLARVGGEAIAGGVVFLGAWELFFWSAAMKRSHAMFRPSNAINLALMKAACDRGVQYYNLGASEGLAGVERFKHDLGARGITYSALTTCAPRFRFYQRVRGALKTEGLRWRRLSTARSRS